MKRTLWHSPWKRVTYHSIPGDPRHFLVQTEFIEDYALHGARVQRDAGHGERPQRDNMMRPAAKVPMSVVHKAMREGWLNDKKQWAKWANDADNKRLRIWEGTL